MPVAINLTPAEGLELGIDGPDPIFNPGRWTLSGDLRSPLTGWSDSNHDYTAAVKAATGMAAVRATVDAEMSCTFVYCETEGDARKLAEALGQVIPPMWAEKRPAAGWKPAF